MNTAARRKILATSLAVFGLSFVACCCPAPPPRSAASGRDGLGDEAVQDERRAVIAKATTAGLIADVKPGTAELWVGPKWYGLDFKDKELLASVVAAYCFKIPKGGRLRGDEILVLFNNKTGKTIGHYSNGGLVLD